MIEIKQVNNKFKLCIDGEFIPNTNVIGEFLNNNEDLSEENVLFRIYINKADVAESIFPYKISEINNFKLITLRFGSGKKWKKVTINKFDQLIDRYSLSFTFESLKRSRVRFPFNDYCEELETVINLFNRENNEYNIQFERVRERKISILFNDILLPLPIGEEIDKFSEIVFELRRKTIIALKERKNEFKLKTLVTSFNFPYELKFSCEQYLIYFIQFLRDLGINAIPNLKEEAGKVLFSVTPIDDVEALDKIREALAVYLNLPSSSINDVEYSENFALMRLQQQIRNLQHSQQMAKTEILSARYALGLAQQNIDNQDRIVVRQNSLIENQEKIIEKITSNSIMIDSVEKKEQRDEFVEFYEGVRAGESKWLRELTGIGLNLPKLINAAVKNTFKKDVEKKSVLGLDEKD